MKAQLYTILSTDSGVEALVSDRIYALVIPQRAWKDQQVQPCIVTSQTSLEENVSYCGTTGLARTRFQIDAYAVEYEAAGEIAAAIKAALRDYRGLVEGVLIKHAALESEFDLTDPEPGLFRVQQTWAFWHTTE